MHFSVTPSQCNDPWTLLGRHDLDSRYESFNADGLCPCLVATRHSQLQILRLQQPGRDEFKLQRSVVQFGTDRFEDVVVEVPRLDISFSIIESRIIVESCKEPATLLSTTTIHTTPKAL